MHRAWGGIEEVPFCFSRSSIKFLGHTSRKSSILIQIGRFRTVTPVWIYWWLGNHAQSLMQHVRGALLFSRSSVKFQGHTGKKNPLIFTQIECFQTNYTFYQGSYTEMAQVIEILAHGGKVFFLSCVIKNRGADALTMQWARASTAMVVTELAFDIPGSAPEGLR